MCFGVPPAPVYKGGEEEAATSFSTALVFPEEEGMMQQSSVSISLSFENQGINPVGGCAPVPRTYTKQINPRNQHDKGLSISTWPLTRVRSDRYDKIIFLVFMIKMQSKIKAK